MVGATAMDLMVDLMEVATNRMEITTTMPEDMITTTMEVDMVARVATIQVCQQLNLHID